MNFFSYERIFIYSGMNKNFYLKNGAFTLLLAAALPGPVRGMSQQAVPLSLGTAIERARKSNPELKAQKAQTEQAKANVQESAGVFLPQVTLSETLVFTNDPLSAFAFKLQQQVVSAADFNPALLNEPGDVQQAITKMDVNMPLVNPDAWQMRKAAKAGYEAAKYKEAYATENISFYVKQVYFGIQMSESAVLVLKKAGETASSMLNLVRENVKAGYAKRADELAVLVKLSEIEAQTQQMDMQVSQLKGSLRLLLGAEESELFALTDSLPAAERVAAQEFAFNASGRGDLQAFASGLKAREAMAGSSKAKWLPSVNAFGSYGLYGENFFSASGSNYQVGLHAQWDLFSGMKRRSGIQRSKAELEETRARYSAYKTESETAFSQAVKQLNVQRTELESARLAVEQSGEALRILQDRFKQGLEKTTDVLMAQTTFMQQELRLKKARYDLFIAVAKLDLLSSSTK